MYSEKYTLRNVLIYGLILFFCALFVIYILFQARLLIAGPTITLFDNLENPQKDRVVLLQGTAENIVNIHLNGRQIFTDKTGYFSEALVLENGYTIATLSGEDRYGRIEKKERTFVYIPQE